LKNRAVKIAGTVADTGASLVVGVVSLVLKTAGAIILIAVTTGIIFACIFVMYIKTNLSTGLDVKLNDFTMSLSSIMYYIDKDSGGSREMVTLQSSEYRRWVDYDKLSIGEKNIEHALVAIEDKRFYEHNGVDWYRTTAAFGNMFLSMKDTFGGSTITQQLIKNLTDDDEATVTRKLTEIFRAIEFEKNYNKEEIVEWYLNIVYFGNHCYGIGAAANYYFGKDAEDMTLAECASIVAITNNPSMYNPYANRERNKKRQDTILTYKSITQKHWQ
jgi:penicillin-binding protein 1A